jgi:hypothetical protein
MTETKVPKAISAYFRKLADKANAKMASTEESRERARQRAANARAALKAKREAPGKAKKAPQNVRL